MEVAAATWAAVSLVLVSIAAKWVWGMLQWLWFKPKRLERLLREQGLKGNSYRFMYGDLKDAISLVEQASSKPMNLSTSHDIAPRVAPFDEQTLKVHGKDSYVWIGTSPMVNITNPEDVKFILTKMDSFPKPEQAPIIKLLAQGIAVYDGEKWTKHRRIINPVFHVEKLKSMLQAFHECCNDMIEEWESSALKEGSSCELDVFPSLQHLTADVISRTSFGSSYKEGRKIFELLKEQTENVIKSAVYISVPGWRFVPTKLNRRMKHVDKEMRSLLHGVIHKREQAIKAGEATKDDLLGALLESSLKDIQENGKNNKNVGLSTEDVIEECKLFYFAGQETTSVLLVWTMILLAQNQDWQDKARQEVLQVFGCNKPDYDGLSHLKVVTMILHEVLRLYPPLVAMSRTAPKQTQLTSFTLPAGVDVAIPTLLIHHDKDLWGDDADEFKPERFAEGVSKATKNRLMYFPFGAGPRICIGQNFAMIESKLALSLILQRFTFELSPSYAHAPYSRLITQPQHGAPIILHKL